MNFEQLIENVQTPSLSNPFKPYKNGNIDCSYLSLSSLEGAPKYVKGYFDCNTNKLTSLKGAPKHVEKYFDCSYNQLTSLDYVPEYIGGDFFCYSNPNISLLELARIDLGNKVKGSIYLNSGFPLRPVDKAKCTRAYYEAVKHTDSEEQQDITNI